MDYLVDPMDQANEEEEPATPDGRWPPSDVIAGEVHRLRLKRGLNREQLAGLCREHGAPESLTAAAIANIETGRRDPSGRRRRSITVDELPFFAAALGVPPLLLQFPLGAVRSVRPMPRHVVETWRAFKWFTGDGGLQGAGSEPPSIVPLFREHDRLEQSWFHLTRAITSGDPRVREFAFEQREQVATWIRRLRGQIRQEGLWPPPLYGDLAMLEADSPEGDGDGGTEDQVSQDG